GGDVGAGKEDRAAVARELAAELRDQGRLAGAVRADQGMDFASVDAQVDAVGRDQPAEALLEAAHVEQRRGRRVPGHDSDGARRRVHRPTMPWRANSTTASRTQPVQNSWCSVVDASTSCSSSSVAAPARPPQTVPTPPRITMTISVPDCVQWSAFGLT